MGKIKLAAAALCMLAATVCSASTNLVHVVELEIRQESFTLNPFQHMKDRIREETKSAVIETAFRLARSGEAEKELDAAKKCYSQELREAAAKVERLAKEEVSRMVNYRLGKLMGEN